MQTYILLQWPESQEIMEESWFNECILGQDIDGHDEVGSSAYFVPSERYTKFIETKANNL